MRFILKLLADEKEKQEKLENLENLENLEKRIKDANNNLKLYIYIYEICQKNVGFWFYYGKT